MPDVLVALLLSGLMGLLGQGIRAAVGLKKAAALSADTPTQQSQFNAAEARFRGLSANPQLEVAANRSFPISPVLASWAVRAGCT